MPVPKSAKDARGFTTTVFGRCALCEAPLEPDHSKCKCGADILYVRQQPKQKALTDMLLARGQDIPVRIGYGGSRGASKSRTIRDAALVVLSELGRRLPGIVVYIIRSVWGDVYQNHVQKLELERPALSKFYDGAHKEYCFPDSMGGCRLVMGYGDTIKDLKRVSRGPEAFMMFIDQAESFSEAELEELHTPNRWPAAGPGGAKTVYAFNPGGPGSEWLSRVFAEQRYDEDRENPKHFSFLQGYGWDNWDAWFANEELVVNGSPLDFDSFYALPGDLPPSPSGRYDREWLNTIPDNHRFKLFVTQTSEGTKMWSKPDSIRVGDLFGRFDAFEGQFFLGVWDSKRVVIR